jgi:16S rRNA C967 or C1407 C5-methylase (RsmB/RsmF family)
MSLPSAFLARLQRIVPSDEYDRVLASFSEPRAVGFRVNTLRAEDPAAVIDELRAAGMRPEEVAGLPLAYTVPAADRENLLAAEVCADGRIYLQDLASQLTSAVLGPQPGERVLDLCAAPGSKTGQIAAMMGQEGELAAVEVVRARFFRMRANLERQGATAVRTFHRDGTTVWRHRPEYFERILLDAPCSTEGRFRADDPESYKYWHPRKTREMARKQQRLLYSAVQSLAPGGVLVYSTCTFAPEENEVVIHRALETFGGALELEDVELPPFARRQTPLVEWGKQHFDERVARAVRLLPTEVSEGFFLARMRKNLSTRRRIKD